MADKAWTIDIPHWHPARLNDLLGHWAKAARLKKGDRELVAHYAKGVPTAKGKRRIGLRITLGKGERGGDVDAFWKSSLDALRHCGVIKDDSKEWTEITPVAYDRGPVRSTRIFVEEME